MNLPIVYIFDVQRRQASAKHSNEIRRWNLGGAVRLLAARQHLARALPLPPTAGERELP
jgi:hypothetical protein